MQNLKNKKIDIIFVTPNLNAGGAERVITTLAQNFDKDLFNVTLVVFGFKSTAKYNVEGTNTVFFNKSRVLQGVFKMHQYLSKEKPDVVLSVVEHLNTVMGYLSIFHKKPIFIGREVNVLSVLETFYKPQNFIEKFIYSNRFKLLDSIICQSDDMKQDLINNYNVEPSKIYKINNPVNPKFETKTCSRDPNILRCITVARLVKPKGHSRILKALSQAQISFHYTIVGSGPEETAIYLEASNLKILDKITFVKHSHQIDKYLQESDLYLQGSYVEGFPNAVIESCAVGTPVLSFNAPGGLNEIIKKNENGFIVEDHNQFVSKLEYIFHNYNFTPTKVSRYVRDAFQLNKIIKEYQNLIINLKESKYLTS